MYDYECTKFGIKIVGEACPNDNVTWFCAYLCRNEDIMNYACCTILCTTYSLLQPFSANIFKSTKVIIFCFQEIFPGIAHILKTHLVNLPATLFSTTIVLFSMISCTPFWLLAQNHIMAYAVEIRHQNCLFQVNHVKVLCLMLKTVFTYKKIVLRHTWKVPVITQTI